MSWDVFGKEDTRKGEMVKSISVKSWQSAPGFGVDEGGTPYVSGGGPSISPPPPPVLPPGVGLGAGAGLLGPVITAAKAADLPLTATAVLGGAAYLTQQQFGRDVVPGSQYGVPFEGPGLVEPSAKYLLKEWHIRMDCKEGDFDLQFYLTMTPSGRKRIFMYNTRTRAWKTWIPPKLAVIGKNMPTHRMVTRLRHNLKRHSDDAKTILKLTNPLAYAKSVGYRKYRKRR